METADNCCRSSLASRDSIGIGLPANIALPGNASKMWGGGG